MNGAVAKVANPRPSGGSRKGIPNKITRELKEMILAALDEAGGVDYLVRQAKRKNPAPFLALVGKVLPLTIKADVDATVRGSVSYRANIPPR